MTSIDLSVGDPTAPVFLSYAMLSRMQREGTYVIAQAKYERDFAEEYAI
jgi:hypothetical protein